MEVVTVPLFVCVHNMGRMKTKHKLYLLVQYTLETISSQLILVFKVYIRPYLSPPSLG